MCLLFNKHTPIRTTNKDIVVYKLLKKYNGDLYSPWFMYKNWELGVKYSVSVFGIRRYMGMSFDCKDKTEALSRWNQKDIWSVAEGFHSAKKIARLRKNGGSEIYKCIIPAGSRYITGVTDLIVSDQLIVLSKI